MILSPDSVQMLCIDISLLTRQSAVYGISNAVRELPLTDNDLR